MKGLGVSRIGRGSLPLEKLRDGFEAVGQGTFGVSLPLLKGTELHQSYRGREFGLIQRRFQPADGIRFPNRNRHFKNIFRKTRDAGNAGAAATKKSAGSQIIQRARLDKI